MFLNLCEVYYAIPLAVFPLCPMARSLFICRFKLHGYLDLTFCPKKVKQTRHSASLHFCLNPKFLYTRLMTVRRTETYSLFIAYKCMAVQDGDLNCYLLIDGSRTG